MSDPYPEVTSIPMPTEAVVLVYPSSEVGEWVEHEVSEHLGLDPHAGNAGNAAPPGGHMTITDSTSPALKEIPAPTPPQAVAVMVGPRVRAVFTGDDAEDRARSFAAQMVASSIDDPQDFAFQHGAWLARADINPI